MLFQKVTISLGNTQDTGSDCELLVEAVIAMMAAQAKTGTTSTGGPDVDNEVDGFFGASFRSENFSTRRYWSTTSVLDMATAYNRSVQPIAEELAEESESHESSSENRSDEEASENESSGEDDLEPLSPRSAIVPSSSLPDVRGAGLDSEFVSTSSLSFSRLPRRTSSSLLRGAFLAQPGKSCRRASVECLAKPDANSNHSSMTNSGSDLVLFGYSLPPWSIGVSPPPGPRAHGDKRMSGSSSVILQSDPSFATAENKATCEGGTTNQRTASTAICRRSSYIVALEHKAPAAQAPVPSKKRRPLPLFSSFKRKTNLRGRTFSEQPSRWPVLAQSPSESPTETRRSSLPVVVPIAESNVLAKLPQGGSCSGPSTPTGTRRGSITSATLIRRIMSPFQSRRSSFSGAEAERKGSHSSDSSPEPLDRDSKRISSVSMQISPGILNRLGVSPVVARRLSEHRKSQTGRSNADDVSNDVILVRLYMYMCVIVVMMT